MASSTPWLGRKRVAFVPLFRSHAAPPDQIPPDWENLILRRVVYDPRTEANGADRSLRAWLRAASSGLADIDPVVLPMQTIDKQVVEADELEGTLGSHLRDQGIDAAVLVMLGGRGAGTNRGFWSRVVMLESNGVWIMEMIHGLTGFKDLYHFNNDVDPRERSIDSFDEMAASSQTHPTAFTKNELGWLDSAAIRMHAGGLVDYDLQYLSLTQPPAAGRVAAVRIGDSFPYVIVEARKMTDQFEAGLPSTGDPQEKPISSEGVIAYRVQTRNPTVQEREGFKKPLFLLTLTALQPGQSAALDNGVSLTVTSARPDGFAIRIEDIINRRGDSDDLAGFVSEISAIDNHVAQVITAVRTASNTLKLISWRLKDDGFFERTSSTSMGEAPGEASNIDIARGVKHVTACRASSGRLTLTSWDVTDAGAITRLHDSGTLAGEASVIKIIAITGTLFVTACCAGNGKLKLISWQLNNDGSFTRIGDREGPETVSEIWLTLLPEQIGGFRHLVTSVRAGDGRLKLFVWSVTNTGVISPQGNSGTQAGEATMIRAVRERFAGRVITAVRAGDGNLKLISWEISGDGNTVTRLGDSDTLAGEIGDNALMSRSLPNGGLISAVRTAGDNLKLIAWKVNIAGSFERLGDSEDQAGAASLITLCQDGLGPEPSTIITAVRTASNTLKLISWTQRL